MEDNNQIVKIVFNYKERINETELEDGSLKKSIIKSIHKKTNIAWFPNVEIDNEICKYVEEKTMQAPDYISGVHPHTIVIMVNETPYHYIPNYFSETMKNKIISDIYKNYK